MIDRVPAPEPVRRVRLGHPDRKQLDPRRRVIERRGRAHHVHVFELPGQKIEVRRASGGLDDDELAHLDSGAGAVMSALRVSIVAFDAALEIRVAVRRTKEMETMRVGHRMVNHEVEGETPKPCDQPGDDIGAHRQRTQEPAVFPRDDSGAAGEREIVDRKVLVHHVARGEERTARRHRPHHAVAAEGFERRAVHAAQPGRRVEQRAVEVGDDETGRSRPRERTSVHREAVYRNAVADRLAAWPNC